MVQNYTLSKSALILATTFAAGLLFVNVYNTFLPCLVFATIIPLAALGVFTKCKRRSE